MATNMAANPAQNTATAKNLITHQPEIIKTTSSLQKAAQKMRDANCGFLLAGDDADSIEGVITDRDIITRAVAKGKDCSKETVQNYLSTQLYFGNENDNIQDLAQKMQENKVNRLIIKNDQGHVCGIVSFGDIVRKFSQSTNAAEAVKWAANQSQYATQEKSGANKSATQVVS